MVAQASSRPPPKEQSADENHGLRSYQSLPGKRTGHALSKVHKQARLHELSLPNQAVSAAKVQIAASNCALRWCKSAHVQRELRVFSRPLHSAPDPRHELRIQQ